METFDSSSRFQVIVYEWDDLNPSTNYKTTRRVGKQIQTININRSKDSPDSSGSITIRGVPPPYWTIGNWVVIYTSKKPFTSMTDGLPLFIGQITHVSTRVTSEENAIIPQITQIQIRPWSSLLQTPIIYDIWGIMQTVKTDASILGTLGKITTDSTKSSYSRASEVLKDIFNPWRYAAVVLSFLGAISEKTTSEIKKEMEKTGKELGNSERTAQDYRETATKLPKIPAELLQDLGYPSSVTPDDAFRAENGFMSMLLGVLTKNSKDIMNNGVFNTEDDLNNLYTPVGDRPILSNVGPEFADGIAAWSLIKNRTDRDNSTEMFTDIWYYKDGDSIKPRPVFVLRDKPFMLKYLKDSLKLTTQWSDYDSVPVVDVPDVVIKSVSLNNTFFNSPNYTTCRFTSPTIKPNSIIANEIFRLSRVKSQNEMNRFGGITYTYNTPYVSINTLNLAQSNKEGVSVNWYQDLAFVQWAWHNNDYRTWHGNMVLLDPGIPLSIGLNIRFKIGIFTCIAQVKGLSYQHQVLQNNIKRTQCSVSFSNLVVERTDGRYEYSGSQFHTQMYTPTVNSVDELEGNVTSTPFSSYEDAFNASNTSRDENWNYLKLKLYEEEE